MPDPVDAATWPVGRLAHAALIAHGVLPNRTGITPKRYAVAARQDTPRKRTQARKQLPLPRSPSRRAQRQRDVDSDEDPIPLGQGRRYANPSSPEESEDDGVEEVDGDIGFDEVPNLRDTAVDPAASAPPLAPITLFPAGAGISAAQLREAMAEVAAPMRTALEKMSQQNATLAAEVARQGRLLDETPAEAPSRRKSSGPSSAAGGPAATQGGASTTKKRPAAVSEGPIDRFVAAQSGPGRNSALRDAGPSASTVHEVNDTDDEDDEQRARTPKRRQVATAQAAAGQQEALDATLSEPSVPRTSERSQVQPCCDLRLSLCRLDWAFGPPKLTACRPRCVAIVSVVALASCCAPWRFEWSCC